MNNGTRTLTVDPSDLNNAINQGQAQGWVLVETTPQPDGKLLLRFEQTKNIQFYSKSHKGGVDTNIAWLELIGLVGFLGIGYIVSGRVLEGLVRMALYMVMVSVGWMVTTLLMAVLVGFCLIPVMLIFQFGIPIWSAIDLKKQLEAQYAY